MKARLLDGLHADTVILAATMRDSRATTAPRSCLAAALLALGLAQATACGEAPRPPVPPVAALPAAPPAVTRARQKPASIPDKLPIVVERRVSTRMRDGTELFADVYRPDAPGRFPVLLQRTPYDRQRGVVTATRMASHGYVVVLQDVRGRWASKGEWYPFVHEAQDGYDTVEWAAALPYANGKVGMFGASYVGATQMLAAAAHPPHLAAIAPDLTASDYHEGWTYQGGAFEQGFAESWSTGLAMDTLQRRLDETDPTLWAKRVPLATYPLLEPGKTDTLAPYFRDWLAHPSDDEYWRALSIERRYEDIHVPALHTGGWYDIFLLGTLRNFVGLKAHGGQRLVVGPWNHMANKGDVDFGPDTVRDTDHLAWFDAVLKGTPTSASPVRIFVMGRNVWRDEQDWPLARAVVTRFYLHGEGRLGQTPPRDEPFDGFVYDPENPVPTRGGGLCCSRDHSPGGAFDQRVVESRKDVLLYTTPPFVRDTEVTGPVAVELYASSNARDTDFTAKLVDVWPSGLAQNLTDGIVRMRWRDSREQPSLLEPGKPYRITIDLAGTSNVFLAGHRMRVEVSSSNFPRFDRNFNVDALPERATSGKKATNRVYHDAAHPSAVVVSVVPD